MRALDFDEVSPDKTHNWVNLTSNDFETLMPLASKDTKAAKSAAKERAIFKLFSMGVVTNRDEWVYGATREIVSRKMTFLIDHYNAAVRALSKSLESAQASRSQDDTIKWTRAVKSDLKKGVVYKFDSNKVLLSMYRPFVRWPMYFDSRLNEVQYQLGSIFVGGKPNPTIAFLCVQSTGPLAALGLDQPFDQCLLKIGNGGTQSLPLFAHDASGNRVDNITDWALKQFAAHYADEIGKSKSARKITKEAIFHYCYAVLHDPLYRDKYAQNLKREFPRIPFYPDFWLWAAWGEALMVLHIGYEAVAPFPLTRTDTPDDKVRAAGLQPKAMLRADPVAGSIALDTETTLRGIPAEAWAYKLGNRCAIDWVLDQYKEKKPKDPTIREKFDTYRFADYKEKVIDLLMRVTTVSIETVKLVEAMKAASR
jgi:predicted helicase